jgi:hypothetical protein
MNEERFTRLEEAVRWTAADVDRADVIRLVRDAIENPAKFRLRVAPIEPDPNVAITIRCGFCRWYTRGKVRDMAKFYQAHLKLKHPEKL